MQNCIHVILSWQNFLWQWSLTLILPNKPLLRSEVNYASFNVCFHTCHPFRSHLYQTHLHTINYKVLLTGISKTKNKISQLVCCIKNHFITFHTQGWKARAKVLLMIWDTVENFGCQVQLAKHRSQVGNIPSLYMGDSRFKAQPTYVSRWCEVLVRLSSLYSQTPGWYLKCPHMIRLQFQEGRPVYTSIKLDAPYSPFCTVQDFNAMKQIVCHGMNVQLYRWSQHLKKLKKSLTVPITWR
jgi:hypothetical protein